MQCSKQDASRPGPDTSPSTTAIVGLVQRARAGQRGLAGTLYLLGLLQFTLQLSSGCAEPSTHPADPDGGAALVSDSNQGDLHLKGDRGGDLSSTGDQMVQQHLLARVFEEDPVNTPTTTLVQLQGVGSDVTGSLTSAPSPSGIRWLRVVSCVDEGATGFVPGRGESKICTLKPLADGIANGDFIYDDWKEGAASFYDPDDRFAEVSAYYHAQRIYSFVTAPEVGLFEDLPRRHMVDGQPVPVTVVVNHHTPAAVGASGLTPSASAAYFPREFGLQGMFAMEGLEGIEGDVMIFGQGTKADFAYSGQVIYHEFGHLIFTALTNTYAHIYADAYGLNHLNAVISEGIAETFVWLLSGRTKLGTYTDTEVGGDGSYLRDAENDEIYPDNASGTFLHDGQFLAAANHEVYTLLVSEAGITSHRFARVLMIALQALEPLNGQFAMPQYADQFLAALRSDGLSQHETAIKQIFTARGLYVTERAKDISTYDGTPIEHTLMLGGAGQSSIQINGGASIAPSYMQTYVDLPAGGTALDIEAILVPLGDSALFNCSVYLREALPIHYDVNSKPVKVTYDQVAEPTLEEVTNTYGTFNLGSWSWTDLTPGARYYIHFINRSSGPGNVAWIKVTM